MHVYLLGAGKYLFCKKMERSGCKWRGEGEVNHAVFIPQIHAKSPRCVRKNRKCGRMLIQRGFPAKKLAESCVPEIGVFSKCAFAIFPVQELKI